MKNQSTIDLAIQMAATNELTLADMRKQIIAEIEKQYLIFLLIRYQGLVADAANAAGVSTVYLRKLTKKHELDPREYYQENDRIKY